MNATPTPAARDGRPGPAGRGPGPTAAAMVVVLGALMTVFDMTVVNVAFHRLSQQFDAGLATVQWVATGYTLALATVIPVSAWAVGRYGAKRVYMTANALFLVGSGLAGLAWNIESLIAFRVLQGLGGGMVMPVGMTILVRAADPGRMGRSMSMLGIPVLIGPLAGPILGGWLIDEASWRWIFFVNLPIGVVVLASAARILRSDPPGAGRRLDVPGLLMLSPGLALLIYGLATGAERSDFTSAGALLTTAAGASLVAGFTVRALTARTPLLDLRLLGRRSFAAPAATLALFGGAYFGSMLLLPLYYQAARGQDATASGLLGIPQALTTGITMQVAGRLIDRVAPGKVVPAGVGLATAGFLAFTSQVRGDTPYWVLMATLAVMGVGVGMTMMPTIAAANRSMSHDEVPVASTMLNIIQQVAASVGTALMSVLLARALAERLPDEAGSGLGAVQDLPADARSSLAPQLGDAFQHSYGWAVALMAAALLPALLLARRTGPPTGAERAAADPVPGDPAGRTGRP